MKEYGRSIIPDPDGMSFHKDMSDEAFMEYTKAKNLIGMKYGVDQGWWESFDRRGPIPFPIIFKLTDFDSKATLAHVMVKAELFESISEARKNGWNKPITTGEWTVGKLRYRVRVHN